MQQKNDILSQITEHYLKSSDFNGFSLYKKQYDKKIIQDLVRQEKIVINFGDRHPNTHILASEPEDKKEQIQKIKNNGITGCAYPTKKHLSVIVDQKKYSDKPFTLMLALGEPQLSFRSFDPFVLEFYRQDPRYYYRCDDVQGTISYNSESALHKPDKNFLEHFGFSYSEPDKQRAVAVFLRYLSSMTPEHQQLWKAKIWEGNFFLHPSYAASSMGGWGGKTSIFSAFLAEQRIINKMGEKMYGKPFFKEVFDRDNKPEDFCFLTRMTLSAYSDFIHTLDKMMGDNLNPDFFDDVAPHETIEEGGKKITVPKGTIRKFEEWINKKFDTKDRSPIDKLINTFKKVRQLRTKPAHKIEENKWNQAYFQKQRELIIEAYAAVRTIRLAFANHPKTKAVEVPDWLYHIINY